MFTDKTIYENKWSKNLPWVEKYRPISVNDIVYQNQVVETLKKSIHNNNLSHLLFYGPPGTGKTSAILAAAKDLYKESDYKNYVLELNASDERGINIIRTKVKSFSQKTISKNNSNNLPNFKLIILDEADSMTVEAQSILRNIIQKYSKITRFCIICNYIDKIIESLVSRCNKFRFFPLDQSSIIQILKNISINENINLKYNTMKYINNCSNGDLRRAITILQSAYYIYGNKISFKEIDYIMGTLNKDKVDLYLDIVLNKTHYDIDKFCDYLAKESYSNYIIINQIFDKLLECDKISDFKKSSIIKIITNSYYNLLNKSNFNIEFLDMTYKITNELHK